MAGHVFISHGSENRDEASALCAFIESRGVTAWMAPRDVRPGIDYSEALQAAIEGCTAFVVLVTDMANKSPYVRAETEMAFSNSKPIFPVRLSDIKPAPGLAFFLKIRHWTDAYGPGREANLDGLARELLVLCGAAPAPLPPAPPSPAPAPPLPLPLPPPPPRPRPPPAFRPNPILAKWPYLAGALLVVAIGLAIWWFAVRGGGETMPPPDAPRSGLDEAGGAAVETTASGLRIETIRQGSGPPVTAADAILVRYETRIENGAVFQGNLNAPEPMLLILADLVPGAAEAALRMQQGGEYRVRIPPELGFGTNIPAGTPLDADDVIEVQVQILEIRRGMAASVQASRPAGAGGGATTD